MPVPLIQTKKRAIVASWIKKIKKGNPVMAISSRRKLTQRAERFYSNEHKKLSNLLRKLLRENQEESRITLESYFEFIKRKFIKIKSMQEFYQKFGSFLKSTREFIEKLKLHKNSFELLEHRIKEFGLFLMPGKGIGTTEGAIQVELWNSKQTIATIRMDALSEQILAVKAI
ncbi:MAG: hypothetical protein Q7K42_02715, partial [Candidatus Diapherotrites archaeon]|nr:hypothetical protein [Candidatus Diapherotrites archaeon]